MKQRIVLVVAVLMGLLAAFLLWQYAQSLEREYRKRLDELDRRYRKASVVTVAKPLPAEIGRAHV